MKIAIDLDDTLAAITEIVIEEHNKKGGNHLTKEQILQWDMNQYLNLDSTQSVGDIYANIWANNSQNIKPVQKDLKRDILKLGSYGELAITTLEPQKNEESIKKWLDSNDVPKEIPVLFLENLRAKRDMDYDVYIDDSPQLAQLNAENNNITILIEQPWNRDFPIQLFNATRVKNLAEAIRFLESIQIPNTTFANASLSSF